MRVHWSTWQVFTPTTIPKCTLATLDAQLMDKVCRKCNKQMLSLFHNISPNNKTIIVFFFFFHSATNIPDGVMRAAEKQSHMGSMKVSSRLKFQTDVCFSAVLHVICSLRVFPGFQHGLWPVSWNHSLHRLLFVPCSWAAGHTVGRK